MEDKGKKAAGPADGITWDKKTNCIDHLALPAEVILMLVGWCTEEMERKYGPGRKPFLSQIRREGFASARSMVSMPTSSA